MRKLFAAIALVGVALLTFQPAAQATGDNNHHPKVWVCKYVGKPGVDERLKDGKQPIQVDSDAVVGTWFKDGQDESFVLDIVTPDNTDRHNDYTGGKTCPEPEPTTTTTCPSTTSSEPPSTSTVPPSTTLPPETTTTQVPETTTSVEPPTSTTQPEPSTTIPEETTTSEPATTTTAAVDTTTTEVATSTSAPPVTTVPTTRPPHGTVPVTTSPSPSSSTVATTRPAPPVSLAFTGGNPDWQVGIGLGMLLFGFLCLALWPSKGRKYGTK